MAGLKSRADCEFDAGSEKARPVSMTDVIVSCMITGAQSLNMLADEQRCVATSSDAPPLDEESLLKQRALTNTYRLCTHDEAPFFLQEQFILTAYRVFFSPQLCLKSLFRLHNGVLHCNVDLCLRPLANG